MSVHDELVISDEELYPTASSPRQEVSSDQLPDQPKRRFPWKKLLVVLGVVVIAAAVFLIANLFKVTGLPFSFSPLKGEAEGRINILMLGVGDPGHDGQDLADTNLVLSINTRSHQIANISIPRDLRVKIPGHGSGKLNLASTYDGAKSSRETIENALGIPIHYYVKANFTGLKQVVDAVGGIDIDNPDDLYDPEYPCDNNQYRSCGFKLKAGHYHLDGATALRYVRCRKGNCGDDFGRAARQQQVMQAIRAGTTSTGTVLNPLKLGKLVAAAGDNIQTDLSVNNMAHLNDLTKKVDKSNIISVVFSLEPDGFLVSSGTSDLLPKAGDFSVIQSFVQNVFTLGPIWSEHPTVVIENGTLVPGIASKFQQKLTDDGYNITVANVMNALTHDHATSQVIDYSAGKKPKTLAYLQDLLKTTAIPPPTPVKYPPADIVIILGQDYANSLAPAPAAAAPAPVR